MKYALTSQLESIFVVEGGDSAAEIEREGLPKDSNLIQYLTSPFEFALILAQIGLPVRYSDYRRRG